MPIIVECPQCGRRLEAQEEWGGRRVKCPECGEAVTIPHSAAQPQRPAAPPVRGPQGALPQARSIRQAQPIQPPPASEGGILDLLDDAALGPTPSALSGSPLGQHSTQRRRKKGSNKKSFVVFGSLAGAGLLVMCCGLGLATLGPAFHAGMDVAIRAKAREIAAKGAPVPVVLAPPPGSVLSEPGPPTGPSWTPDSQWAAQLTTSVSFDRYSLELPAGFTIAKPPWKHELLGQEAQNWFWASQPLPNGARHVITAEIIEFTVEPQRFVGDLEAELAQRMSWKGKPDSLSEFERTPGERGQIAGVQFIRSSFTGSHKGVRIYGALLLAMDENRMLELQGQWLMAPGTPEYQALAAAMLSFHK